VRAVSEEVEADNASSAQTAAVFKTTAV